MLVSKEKKQIQNAEKKILETFAKIAKIKETGLTGEEMIKKALKETQNQ